jgi:hypothetical protein
MSSSTSAPPVVASAVASFPTPTIGAITDAVIFPAQDIRTSHLLYELLGALHHLLVDARLTYWLDGGSALGCVRHGGIIPWDDDADISMFACDRERLQRDVIDRVHRHHPTANATAAACASAGASSSDVVVGQCVLSRFEFVPTYFGWKFCDRSSPRIGGHAWRYPSVDIFFVDLPAVPRVSSHQTSDHAAIPSIPSMPLQRLIFSSDRAQRCWGNMNWFAHEILQPPEVVDAASAGASRAAGSCSLEFSSDDEDSSASAPSHAYSSTRTTLRLYPFAGLHLYAAPHSAVSAYLTRCYGSDWSTVAYRIFDHAREKKYDRAEQRVRITLQAADLEPAQTNGIIDDVRCTCIMTCMEAP